MLHALDMLRDDGFEITLLPVGERGVVDTDAFARALRDDTILASVMYANNELGTIQPLYELAAIAQRAGHELASFQSNAEHVLVEHVQRAREDGTAFIVINRAGSKIHGPMRGTM